jgi:Trk K+ transport system NAD-binding subunit
LKRAIYGYSKSSLELARMLKLKRRDFLLVLDSEEEVERVEECGYETLILDLTHDKGLKELGVGKTLKELICMHRDYNKNLFVTLSARKLDNSLTIISRASTVNDAQKLKLAGASFTVNPYDLGSHRIFRMIKKPYIFDVLDQIIYSDMPIEISEIEVAKNSPIIGKEFSKLTIEDEYDIVIIGVQSADSKKFYYNTHKVYRKIKGGDILVVIGEKDKLKKLSKGLKDG